MYNIIILIKKFLDKFSFYILSHFIVLMIIFFIYSIVNIFVKKDRIIIKDIENKNKIAQKKIDSLEKRNNILNIDLENLNKQIITQDSILKIHKENLKKGVIKNKKDNNEKNFIPNASFNEQIDFISKYKYISIE